MRTGIPAALPNEIYEMRQDDAVYDNPRTNRIFRSPRSIQDCA